LSRLSNRQNGFDYIVDIKISHRKSPFLDQAKKVASLESEETTAQITSQSDTPISYFVAISRRFLMKSGVGYVSIVSLSDVESHASYLLVRFHIPKKVFP
jgi:hypothetical protein